MPTHRTIVNYRRHASSIIHNRKRQLEEKIGLLLAQAKMPSSFPKKLLVRVSHLPRTHISLAQIPDMFRELLERLRPV